MAGIRLFRGAWGVAVLCLVACTGPAATSTGTAPAGTAAAPASTAAAPTTSMTSARPSSTSPSTSEPSTTSSTGATGATAQERYLAQARIDLPHADRAALIATERSICATIRTGSRDDAVGELAAQLGSQPAAYQLVMLATDAYCPQPPHTS